MCVAEDEVAAIDVDVTRKKPRQVGQVVALTEDRSNPRAHAGIDTLQQIVQLPVSEKRLGHELMPLADVGEPGLAGKSERARPFSSLFLIEWADHVLLPGMR